MNDCDRRQVECMVAQLSAYQTGKIDLAWLISSLESLFYTLEGQPESWRAEFRRHWGVLEEAYSVSIVRAQPTESKENSPLVANAITALQQQLDSVLRLG